jgi:7-cyano-7-deazaguanine synthase
MGGSSRPKPPKRGFVKRILLLSGGLDSSMIASIERPDLTLMIDYGQRPAQAEAAAAAAIARHLGLQHVALKIDLSSIGSGLLVGSQQNSPAPTPEWFPFRNQFLATAAAAYAVNNGFDEVHLGTVAGDGARHADGTPAFVAALDDVMRLQEGAIRVRAPHIDSDPTELLRRSGLPEGVARWTFSCHTGNLACGQCPGCNRRRDLLVGTWN